MKPWEYYSGSRSIYDGDGISVAILTGPRGNQERQDRNAALILRSVQCEEIVRALAEQEPRHMGDDKECVFCGEYVLNDAWEIADAEKHKPDCIWRRAKEIVV